MSGNVGKVGRNLAPSPLSFINRDAHEADKFTGECLNGLYLHLNFELHICSNSLCDQATSINDVTGNMISLSFQTQFFLPPFKVVPELFLAKLTGCQDVLPYFKELECNDQGSSEFRGTVGPLFFSTMTRNLLPLCDTVVEAGLECGYPRNEDFNGPTLEGFGLYQNTAKNGLRMSAARTYLQPVRGRKNFRIECDAQVTRVLIDGKKAIGTEYRKRGKLHSAFAGREVVLCAGAINSPQILQISGVGSASLLKQFEIDVVHCADGVGQNLQEYL